MLDDLLPCPYCGKSAEYVVSDSGLVACSDEDCRLCPILPIQDWQNRPVESELRNKIEELQRRLGKK